MENRLKLQDLLESILGNRNVYFQPPESIKINYPAIVYELSDIKKSYANGGVYLSRDGYSVTLIDKNPDSQYIDKLINLPFCRFVRHFKNDNLNHYVFIISNI